MAIVTLQELIDLVIMTLALGYIFKDTFHIPVTAETVDVVDYYKNKARGLLTQDFWYAALITAPAVLFHELGHKFVALGFGLNAIFHAHYPFLALGVILKALNAGFIFFIPGYVSYQAFQLEAWKSMLISGAGPFVNLLLWVGCKMYLRYAVHQRKKLSDRVRNVLVFTAKINLFLFIFNMLPIPPFDGFKFFTGLWKVLTGAP